MEALGELGQAEHGNLSASLVVGAPCVGSGAEISSRSCQGTLPTQTSLERADANGEESGKHLDSRPEALLVFPGWNYRKKGDGEV